MKEIIHDIETGEITEKDYTQAQIKEAEAMNKVRLAKLKAEEEAALAKATLLAKLGITEEEAKLLFS
ncbi:MAG: hypothetical protein EBW87_01510 [Burkholderiaceae bacterium]|nr:hypothetical protein [Burkholderiaceae bacterium]